MFAEDRIPECRSTAHPAHTDKRKWMIVIKEESDYVVWCCQRCSEIARVPAIQVRVLPRGRARARYALGPKPPTAPRHLALPSGLHVVKPPAGSGDSGL